MTAGELLLPMYESFCFLILLSCLFFIFELFSIFVITQLNGTDYKNKKIELSDNYLVNVCFESNIIDVSSNTLWLDSGATIHDCNSMQVVIRKRSPTSLEQYVYMEDDTRVQVDFLRVVRLRLITGNFLELQDVVYIPSIMRNLISIHILDRLGYNFLFGTRKVKLYQYSLLIGIGILCGNLYRLELYVLSYVSTTLTLNTASSSKRF